MHDILRNIETFDDVQNTEPTVKLAFKITYSVTLTHNTVSQENVSVIMETTSYGNN